MTSAPRRPRTPFALLAVIALVALGLLAGAAPSAGADPPPAVELDKLLRIPKTAPVENVRHGGATRSEWQARFASAQEDLDDARAALAAAREELAQVVVPRVGELAHQVVAMDHQDERALLLAVRVPDPPLERQRGRFGAEERRAHLSRDLDL